MKLSTGKNRLELLRIFFTNPDKAFFMQEVGRMLGKKPGVFQRTLNALEEEGLLKSEFRGNSRFFQANTQHPLYPEVKVIIAKTTGVQGALRDLVKGLKDVKMALLYGSFAKGTERKDSDIDLLVVGKPDVENRLLKEIPRYEKKLQREINYKLYSEKEYSEKRKSREPFLEEILTDKNIVLKGSFNAI
jgi:predicted nucleotidyltransferase